MRRPLPSRSRDVVVHRVQTEFAVANGVERPAGKRATRVFAGPLRPGDVLVTGEATFHDCLEAEAREMGLLLTGHFASERFALLSLADYLTDQRSDAHVWASRSERDPLQTL